MFYLTTHSTHLLLYNTGHMVNDHLDSHYRHYMGYSDHYQYHTYSTAHIKPLFMSWSTGPDGAVVMSSANGLVGTGFASRYRLQSRAVFKDPMGRCKTTTPSSLSLASNRVTTNY